MNLKRKKIAEKVINILLNVLVVIFGFILLVSIYTGIQTKLLGNAHANFFGYSIFEVLTGSMADTINPGDCIIVSLTKDVKLNDIITYKVGDEYITHRVIEVYSGTYVTKGDANNAKDKPIDQDQVVGKVVTVLPHFGIFRKTLFNPGVLITLIITLFFFNLAFKKNKSDEYKTVIINTYKKVINNDIIKKIIRKVADWIKSFKKPEKDIDDIFEENLLDKVGKNFGNNKPKDTNEQKLDKGSKQNVITADETENKNKEIKTEEENIEHHNDNETSIYHVVSFDDEPNSNKKESEIDANEDDEIYHDSELEKTSFYRVISVDVDAGEVEQKYKDLVPKIKEEMEAETENIDEESDLEKTSLYRIISVDASEVDDTLLEIAQNEMKVSEQTDKNKKNDDEDDSLLEKAIEEEKEGLTQVNLELLDKLKNNLKGKNVIETVMNIKRAEMNEIADLLYDDEKIRFSKNNIKKAFIAAYIDVRYYNYVDNIETNSKNMTVKLTAAIKKVAADLIKDYRGNDAKYDDVVNMYAKTFAMIVNLEKAKESISSLNAKREFYKKEITKFCKESNNPNVNRTANEIIKVQRNYSDMIEYYLGKLETNMFTLSINKFTTKKDIFGVKLEHNLTFSKIYSDYIIDKTYTEGVVAEDKMIVLANLLLVQICKDMLAAKFNKKYILYIPNSLYTKERKLEKLLKIIDDKYVKDNTIILVTFEDLLNYKKVLKEIKKMDYHFALVFDKDTTIGEKDRGNIYIADYIFMTKKIVSSTKILQFIPEDLISKIVYEDVIDKVGDVKGD